MLKTYTIILLIISGAVHVGYDCLAADIINGAFHFEERFSQQNTGAQALKRESWEFVLILFKSLYGPNASIVQ